jgi:two-component system phosphate regulon sensor histidine kinase PhoR
MNTRVLVVDDDHALLEALPVTVGLRMTGVEMDTCDSGAGALDLLEEIDYDAVITDIKMPGMDGLTLLTELRTRRPRTPILLITGHGDRELAVGALRGGAFDFILKPIDRDYLVAALARAIEMRRLDRETERQQVALERHARVLEHIGDGVFLVGADETIQLWNQAAEAITGLPAEQVTGLKVEEIFHDWQSLAPLIPVSRMPGTSAEPAKTIPIELDGHESWISVTGVEFENGTVYAFRSLSSERAIDELRDEFVTVVSHELKTPLAAIYGAAETLRARKNELDEHTRGPLLDMIVTESDRLARIVNDILIAGQLDSGRFTVETDAVDPVVVARDAIEALRLHARGVDVRLVAQPSVPAAHADARQLRQVLDNLLENAVKYSSGEPRIEVRVDVQGDHVRVAVADQGLGIPSDELRRIFAKFYRLDPYLTGGVGGTGLGLYICRELVRRMGGRISASSKLGHGSTFTVDLAVANGRGGSGLGAMTVAQTAIHH